MGTTRIALNQALGDAGAASVNGQLPSNGGEASGGGLWSEGTSLTINYGAFTHNGAWVPAALRERGSVGGERRWAGGGGLSLEGGSFSATDVAITTTKPRAATAARPGPGATRRNRRRGAGWWDRRLLGLHGEWGLFFDMCQIEAIRLRGAGGDGVNSEFGGEIGRRRLGSRCGVYRRHGVLHADGLLG